ncbi:MAG: alpha/beta hydrolase [Hyphomonas sp.]|nr:alpha/beta hydrolase [Hyphomonas sp.]
MERTIVRGVGMWLFKLIGMLAATYVAVVAIMYVAQTHMLFPTRMASANPAVLPAHATQLEVETPDGVRLHGVHIVPEEAASEERLVVMGFGGNAWNAANLAAYLHDLLPDVEVVAFHYRGYQPSSGSPSAAALLADAPILYDYVVANLGTERVVAVGFSIGSGVAAHLASRRPLAGLILVSPFDSLKALVRAHYPWAPVQWLLRHHMSPAEDLRGLTTPVAVIAAARDRIIPPRRTNAVRQAFPALVFDRTIADAGHNDLYARPDFRTAMAEALALINSASTD